MKDVDIQIESLDFTKPISFYSNVYGLSEHAIRNRFKKLGVYNNFYFTKGNTAKIKSELLKSEYLKTPKICPNCNNVISYRKKENTYCSQKCAAIYTQKDGGHCKWSEENKKRLSEMAKSNPSWNRNYKFKDKIKKICPMCNIEFEKLPSQIYQICCSKKCSTVWINKTGYLKGKSGGYRKEAGRGKMGWYKEYYCQSSWELAWVIYNLDHNISFRRNTNGFEYIFENKKYKFYPDFILDDGSYVEIKGYPNKKTNNKITQFPHKLNVLFEKDMSPFLEYVKLKYGNDFIKLYEGNPYNEKKNKCVICGEPAKNIYCSRKCSGKNVGIFTKNLRNKTVI